ncbi:MULTISPECIES: class I SAM-dependent methyltransferase [Corynebacterium]|uniref:class I SAM-dependent methyltransferase n=1 Tax=Corynebacterium TaxID=1716 RepID=UPI00124F5D11|nr:MULTISPECIES: class I SAM-dependent methyltransferase [Corynebacterium]
MADHAHNLAFSSHALSRPTSGPVGVVTRGTTGAHRLRKLDRWLHYQPEVRRLLRSVDAPLAIDLGYGASFRTTCEWAYWLRRTRPDIAVVGLEIEPSRVLPPRDGVRFELGGFELAGYHPHLLRAFNVLRQYDAAHVPEVWQAVGERLADGGMFIDGTCDELGRRSSWVLLDHHGPRTLTLAWDPHHTPRPSLVAERLPKILIHRNVAGERIYDFLRAADAAWDQAAGWSSFGPRIRWRHALETLATQYPLHGWRRGVRDNVVTVDFAAVAPR